MFLLSLMQWILTVFILESISEIGGETVITEIMHNVQTIRSYQEPFEPNSQSEMKMLSGMFDQHQWENRLSEIENESCKAEMELYVGNLQTNTTLWAAKMFDASGRYNGHFFFGNDFWLGSSSLCSELQDKKINPEVSPFPTEYFVAKLAINFKFNVTTLPRQIHLGICLPKSCGIEDVRKLLLKEANPTASMRIINVRTVPGSYRLLHDSKFQIIGTSAVITVALIFVASVVEVLIKRKSSHLKPTELDTEHNKGRDHSTSKEKIITKENEPQSKSNFLLNLLLAFSAITNGNKILAINTGSKDVISCLHGLRVFSIGWIILVHSYLQVFGVARNKYLRTITERNFMYQTIANATYSVDTFFFISGLLVTFGFFKSETSKDNSNKARVRSIWASFAKFTLMISYRFIRLTPAYLFVLGTNEIVLRYIHNTSVFTPGIIDHITCDKYWWRNALYINNFYPQAEICMLWSWYIANDTQFFVVASALLLVAVRGNKHLRYAAVSVAVLLVASWVSTFVIAMKHNYIARVQEPFALFDELYDKPWMRIGPYLIGMIIGYMMFKLKGKIILTMPVVALGWTLSLSCLGALVYGLGNQGLVVPASAFYVALGHTAWALSLAWITVACNNGHGGPFNTLFSCKFFLPLSRLTYAAYLVHPILMFFTSFSLDGSLQIHNLITVVIFFGNVVLSFVAAFVISLLFEAPAINLMRLIF